MTPPEPPTPEPRGPDNSLWVYAGAVALLIGLLIARGYAPTDQARPTELVAAGLDPNRAEAVELEQLPGFGPTRAQSVVRHRTAYGPLADTQDLERIPGVGPGTAERARPHLIPPTETLTRKTPPPVKAGKIRPGEPPIDINTASEEELTRLPKVGPVLARGIAEARPFASVDDLRRVKGIGSKTLETVRPFVTK